MGQIKVEGMHCCHCKKAVENALNALEGAEGVVVDLDKGLVSWTAMGVDIETVKETVEDLGFDAMDVTCACSGQCDGKH